MHVRQSNSSRSLKSRVLRAGLGVALAFGASLSAVVVSRGVALAKPLDPQGTIYVADYETNAINVFPPGTNGNTAPERMIQGAGTGLDGPADVKVDASGDVWASNFYGDTITEYAPGASGNATPICTISGSKTNLDENDDISLEPDGTLVVGNFTDAADNGGSVVVFSPGSCGNVAPAETISGSSTGLSLVDGVGTDAAGTIFADSTDSNSIQVFPAGANGNVAPTYTISGSNTGLGSPDDVVVGFDGKLYVSNGSAALTVYAPGAKGNATPTQDITGSNTDLGGPDDLAVDTAGDIYVTDEFSALGAGVLEYASGATGNVAPITSIAGSSTGFAGPEGVYVAGPPSGTGATVTTTDSGRSISLGGSSSDTATVTEGTNGHSPTGSLVFKLFGPNDATCSHAPAFVSSSQHVRGPGNYSSGNFTPTAVGTYSWQALYSGDTNNPPVTTACSGIAAETVTVQQGTTGCSKPGVTRVFEYGNAREEIVRVVIRGHCFRGATKVLFGSVPAESFTVTSDGTIQASPPQQPAGTVDVTVTTPGGTSAVNAPADQYRYYLPQIEQVLPNHGPVAGGNTVLIRGFGFSGSPPPTVSFGGNPSTSVVVMGDGNIHALVPPHSAGTVNVQVTTFAGSSHSSSGSQYKYK
jgi:sugar lactone lactonase YvrE